MEERHLAIRKSIVSIDLETTGLEVDNARIVEIAVIKLFPDGDIYERVRRVNPQIPIPPQATAVHGITDKEVEDKPVFGRLAKSLLELIGDADLLGYNIISYDLPILNKELSRVGLNLDMSGRAIVDVFKLLSEPMTLSKAYNKFCEKKLEQAHTASADAMATLELLQALIRRNPHLPNDINQLALLSEGKGDSWVDPDGKLVWREGEAVFSFGKYKGHTLKEVAQKNPDYLEWIKKENFPKTFRMIVISALKGEFPVVDV